MNDDDYLRGSDGLRPWCTDMDHCDEVILVGVSGSLTRLRLDSTTVITGDKTQWRVGLHGALTRMRAGISRLVTDDQ